MILTMLTIHSGGIIKITMDYLYIYEPSIFSHKGYLVRILVVTVSFLSGFSGVFI